MSVSLPLSGSCVRPSREPLLDLLQQPTVAVGIAEGGIRGIGTALRIWTPNARLGACVKAPVAKTIAASIRCASIRSAYASGMQSRTQSGYVKFFNRLKLGVLLNFSFSVFRI